jgi:hypothetical protein
MIFYFFSALVGDLVKAFGPSFLPTLDTPEYGITKLIQQCRRARLNKAKAMAKYVCNLNLINTWIEKILI